MYIKLGLAQMRSIVGNVDANLHKHLDIIEQAKQAGVDLSIFPELSLTGYNLQDLTTQVATRPAPDNPVFAPLFEASKDLDLVIGFVDEDQRHRFYIAAAYLSQGELLHVHRKCYLPTYGLFDEGRYFAAGNEVKAFDTRFGRIGMLICEDYWHASTPYLLWMDGAEVLIMMSAHPGRGLDSGEKPGSVRWIETVGQAHAAMCTVFVAHCLRVGTEDGFTFWAESIVYSPEGERISQAEYMLETLHIVEIDLNDLHRVRARLPLLRDERADLTARTLNKIIDDCN